MKKITAENKYKVIGNSDLNFISLNTLYYCYLPILGSSAISLYHFLIVESNNFLINNIFIPIERILMNCNILVEEFNEILIKLSELNLLVIYEDNKNSSDFFFKLKKPVESISFFENNIASKMLQKKINKINFNFNKNFLTSNSKDFSKYKILSNDSIIESENDLNFNFNSNIDILFQKLKFLEIDIDSFWNDEWNDYISEIIIFEGIEIKDIVAIFNMMNKHTKTFSIKEFKKIIKTIKQNNFSFEDKLFNKNKVQDKKFDILKSLNVHEFIELRLSRKPTKQEQHFIENLSTNHLLDNSLINLLIDFSILKNKNIVINYLEKIINTAIIKNEIKDFDELLSFLKNAYNANVKKNSKQINQYENNSFANSEELDKELLDMEF